MVGAAHSSEAADRKAAAGTLFARTEVADSSIRSRACECALVGPWGDRLRREKATGA
jgi:hypothetical protein